MIDTFVPCVFSRCSSVRAPHDESGRHPAALNIGDCFAYALARATGEPLLYKGDDFVHTDIASAA